MADDPAVSGGAAAAPATTEFARILAENERFTEVYDRTALSAAPLTGLAIVACMDTRLTIDEALGLRPGDAHLIRNAGGLVTDDVIRSLIVSQQQLGTDEILVIMHTGCGLLGLDETALRERLAATWRRNPCGSIYGFVRPPVRASLPAMSKTGVCCESHTSAVAFRRTVSAAVSPCIA